MVTIFLLCISTFLSYLQMRAEDNSRSAIGDSCNSPVDNSTLFHGCTQLADRHALYSEGFCSESNSSNFGQSPSTSSTSGVAGMHIIRQSLQDSEISPVMMQSWRDSTHKQYKVYINKWLQFCGEGSHDPLHPSVRSVLSFLHRLFKKGLSYSALNTARSAVSNIDINVRDVQDRTPVGKHFLVCRVSLTRLNLCQNTITFGLWTLSWII